MSGGTEARVRVVHTVSSVGIEAAGPSYTVPRLCEALIAAGVDARIAVLDLIPRIKKRPYIESFPLGFGPRRLGRSRAMAGWLNEEALSGRVDVLHSHGLWMMPNVYPGWTRRDVACRLVVSPRGMLSEWAMNYHALRKKVFWSLFQAQTLRRADAFHATGEPEYDDIRRRGFRQPVCILPNGVDVPTLRRELPQGRRKILYLGRIHKKKGIDLLLRAWRAVEDRFPDWELVVAGPDDGGYLANVRALAMELGLKRVRFVGALYGDQKARALRTASLYVLPTHSENFGVTVAEALAAATPVITTRGAPWSGLETHDAGWWIKIGVDPLVACLEEALALPEERLAEMGYQGRAWMKKEFLWDAIGRQMAAFYRWLCGHGEQPACVQTD